MLTRRYVGHSLPSRVGSPVLEFFDHGIEGEVDVLATIERASLDAVLAVRDLCIGEPVSTRCSLEVSDDSV